MAVLPSQRSWLRSLRLLLLALGGLALPASAQELAQGAADTCRTMGPQAVMGICAITLIGTFTALITMRRRLGKEGWSLANALSEPTRLTIPIDPRWSQSQGDDQADQGGTAGISAVGVGSAKEGPPAALTILEASSSRLIAMVGMVVILLTYLGFGIFSLYTFGLTCQMPASTAAVTSFLYAGLTLFAPYAANKVSGILQPVLGSKPQPPPETAGTRLTPQAGGGLRPLAAMAPPLAAASPAAPSAGNGAGDAAAQRAAAPAAAAVGQGVPQPAHRDGNGSASGMGAATGVAAAPPRKPSGTPPTHRTFPVAHPPVEEPPTTKRTTTTPSSGAGDPDAAAVALIAEFEGFVDHAYPDPASGGEPWTIGYGFTSLQGRPVRPGDTISEAEAKQQLASGVEACGKHLAGTIPAWAAMAADQRCALISFAWNLGEDFYGSDGFNTISERLRDHQWAEVPAALELYCDPGSSVSAGLLRRRQAEGALWRQGLASPSVARAGTASANATATASSADRAAKPSSGTHPNPLNVRWYDQLAMNDGQGWRDCFSASSAMLATYWGKEPNEDDYNSLRQSYGDTTSAEAQLAALRHLGLQAEFRTDGTLQTLRDEIDAGRPVAVGWLHHGPSSDPGGGGHWTVVIGYDETGVIMNDPYGSCDLVNGGYPQNHNGARQHYSFKNWEPRWRPQGSGGWYLTCRS